MVAISCEKISEKGVRGIRKPDLRGIALLKHILAPLTLKRHEF